MTESGAATKLGRTTGDRMPEPLSLTLTAEQIQQRLERFNALPIAAEHRVRAEPVDAYRLRCVLEPIEPRHLGGLHGRAVNGAVLASMFDMALGMPGVIRAAPDKRSATVQLSMSFMRAFRGERVAVESWINRAGTGLLFTEAEIVDAEGNLCASATGIVRIFERGRDAPAF